MPCLVLDNLQYNSYVQDNNNKRIIIISEATYHISCVQIIN